MHDPLTTRWKMTAGLQILLDVPPEKVLVAKRDPTTGKRLDGPGGDPATLPRLQVAQALTPEAGRHIVRLHNRFVSELPNP